jgi:hypothetical protein
MAGCCVTSWGAGGDGRLGIRNMRSQKSSSDDDVEGDEASVEAARSKSQRGLHCAVYY